MRGVKSYKKLRPSTKKNLKKLWLEFRKPIGEKRKLQKSKSVKGYDGNFKLDWNGMIQWILIGFSISRKSIFMRINLIIVLFLFFSEACISQIRHYVVSEYIVLNPSLHESKQSLRKKSIYSSKDSLLREECTYDKGVLISTDKYFYNKNLLLCVETKTNDGYSESTNYTYYKDGKTKKITELHNGKKYMSFDYSYPSLYKTIEKVSEYSMDKELLSSTTITEYNSNGQLISKMSLDEKNDTISFITSLYLPDSCRVLLDYVYKSEGKLCKYFNSSGLIVEEVQTENDNIFSRRNYFYENKLLRKIKTDFIVQGDTSMRIFDYWENNIIKSEKYVHSSGHNKNKYFDNKGRLIREDQLKGNNIISRLVYKYN